MTSNSQEELPSPKARREEGGDGEDRDRERESERARESERERERESERARARESERERERAREPYSLHIPSFTTLDIYFMLRSCSKVGLASSSASISALIFRFVFGWRVLLLLLVVWALVVVSRPAMMMDASWSTM